MAGGRQDIEAGAAFVRVYVKNKELQRGLVDVKRRMSEFGRNVTDIGKGLMAASAAAVGPILGATKHWMDFGGQLDDMSQRTGVSVESLSELKYACEQSGTTIDGLGASLFRMRRRIANAVTGTGPAVRALEELGLSAEDLSLLPVEEQFNRVVDALASVDDPSRAAQMAFEILGDNARDLWPLLQKGAQGIAAMREEGRKKGFTVSAEDAAAAAKFADTLDDLKQAAGMAAMAVGSAVGPAIREFIEKMMGSVKAAREWVQEHQQAVVTALKVAAAVGAVGAAVTAIGVPFLAAASAIGGAVSALSALKAAMAFLVANPVVAAIAGITAGVIALNAALNTWGDVSVELANTQTQLRVEAEKQNARDLARLDRLRQLEEAGELTAAQQQEAKSIIAGLTNTYGDLGVAIDETTGKLIGLEGAQARVNAAMREKMESQLRDEIREKQGNLREINEERETLHERGAFGLFKSSSGFRESRNAELRDQARAEMDKLNALIRQLEMLKEGSAAALTGATPAAETPAEGGPVMTNTLGDEEEAAENTRRMAEERKAAEERAARALADLQLDLIENEEKRELAKIKAKYAREREEMKKLGADTAKLDEAEETETKGVRDRFKRQRQDELDDMVLARKDREEAIDREIAENRLKETKEGLALELALLDLEKKEALKEGEAKGDDLAQIKKQFEVRAQLLKSADLKRFADSYQAPTAMIRGTQAEYNARIQQDAQEKIRQLLEQGAARDERRNQLLDGLNNNQPKAVDIPK